MLKNSNSGYGWVSITLHWLTALTVIGLFAVGYWMVDLNYYSEWYQTAPHYHKSVGLLLAAVTLFRLAWKIQQPSPQLLGARWEKHLAKLGHIAFYILLFSLFMSGYLISTADGRSIEVFNWFSVPSMGEWIANQEDIAGEIHEWLAYSIIGLALLHALAALKHHVINKDNTLVRMLSPSTSQQPTLNEEKE
ncbi:cytochrome b [Aestuariibacter sp. AA17]|uniref:Cytochrome b n=1 Tax=Fluctibacter corallii TaxID=2984329 RepID=A0ABT3A8Q7_9ALTE|nr:cytochrome b [Aestuariibacter sp. AA17]MCV2885075.1 cytochrome b [Aestuariibacter sp. AA17]